MVAPDNLRPISPTPTGLAVLREWSTPALEVLVAECNKILGERGDPCGAVNVKTTDGRPFPHSPSCRNYIPPMVPEEV